MPVKSFHIKVLMEDVTVAREQEKFKYRFVMEFFYITLYVLLSVTFL